MIKSKKITNNIDLRDIVSLNKILKMFNMSPDNGQFDVSALSLD